MKGLKFFEVSFSELLRYLNEFEFDSSLIIHTG